MYPFPPNAASRIPKKMRQEIFLYMLHNYIWPQIMERRQFESQWDKLRDMARATWKYDDLEIDQSTRLKRKAYNTTLNSPPSEKGNPDNRIQVSDTLIFDAVDRLTNLNHFISWKDSKPVQFSLPEDRIYPFENDVYSPSADVCKAWNCWLQFNIDSQEIYRKHLQLLRHHYTYGLSFVASEFEQRIEPMQRRQPDNSFKPELELTKIGITFEPISLRKIWLNYRLPMDKLHYQQCPFWFEIMPRFALLANSYDPQLNPMGYSNLSALPSPEYLLGSEAVDALYKQWQTTYPDCNLSVGQLLAPEFNVELKWNLYPMLPLGTDPKAVTQPDPSVPNDPEANPDGYVFDADGSKGLPFSRFIVQTFGNNLTTGNQEIVSIQPNFYPEQAFPLYGSAHMPTLDDGTYSAAIGTILEGHYTQLCKCLEQFILNKDWINDPPALVQTSSPAMSVDLNKLGSRIAVNGPNDVQRRQPFDGTGSTPQVMESIRNQGQTSSKVVDAILGKAMGSRTTASEAQNAFQTAMAGVTTDVNMATYDIFGGYASHLWEYTGLWVDPGVLGEITGFYGAKMKPQDIRIRMGIKYDTGSVFIESITRASNIQTLLQVCPPGDPEMNRAALLKELMRQWKFADPDQFVNDNGVSEQIQLANFQACQTYLGRLVMVRPDQNHQLAIKVKISYLEDTDSVWNTDPAYAQYGQRISQQIEMHQKYIMIAQQQQLAQQHAQLLAQHVPLQALQSQKEHAAAQIAASRSSPPSGNAVPANPGMVASQQGTP